MPRNKGQVRRRAYVEDEQGYIRSRTISGYEPTNSIKSVELERKNEQKKVIRKSRRKWTFIIFLIIIGVIAFVFSQTIIQVSSIEYNDSTISRGQDEDYLNVTRQYLAEFPSERFGWVRKEESLTSYIQNIYPEVGNAEIRGGFGAGKLYLEIRQPVAVWKTNSSSSYVDKDGAVFNKNYYQDPEIIINDQSGSGLISQRFLQFIGRIISGIKESGIGEVKKVSIPVNSTRFVEITISGYGYPVKIQTDRDTDSQIADVVNMIKYLDRNNIKPSYVDVRVKNRGFWK